MLSLHPDKHEEFSFKGFPTHPHSKKGKVLIDFESLQRDFLALSLRFRVRLVASQRQTGVKYKNIRRVGRDFTIPRPGLWQQTKSFSRMIFPGN
jgi:hypothetical protein